VYSNLERIKEAIGDKLGLLIQSFVQFFAGFGIAFYYSWKLTLMMMIISPLVGICGLLVGKVRWC
jgi:ABC-type multidrug transport system fused ATPase/permease subunit